MKGSDLCKCGHRRDEHNNRIKGHFFKEIKYNACMHYEPDAKNESEAYCDCIKFQAVRD